MMSTRTWSEGSKVITINGKATTTRGKARKFAAIDRKDEGKGKAHAPPELSLDNDRIYDSYFTTYESEEAYSKPQTTESDEERKVKARREKLRQKELSSPFKFGTLQVITPAHSTKFFGSKTQTILRIEWFYQEIKILWIIKVCSLVLVAWFPKRINWK